MKEILCFGDSNTYGLIPGTTSRFDRSTRWTGILESALFPNGYKIDSVDALPSLKMSFVTTDAV